MRNNNPTEAKINKREKRRCKRGKTEKVTRGHGAPFVHVSREQLLVRRLKRTKKTWKTRDDIRRSKNRKEGETKCTYRMEEEEKRKKERKKKKRDCSGEERRKKTRRINCKTYFYYDRERTCDLGSK